MTTDDTRKIVERHGKLLSTLPFQVTADIYDGRFACALAFIRTYVGSRNGSKALQDELEKQITELRVPQGDS